MTRRRSKPSGFTLWELIIVIVIISIVALIATPNIVSALQSLRASAAAQKLLTDIRYVRELALSHHTTYGIEFNAAGNSYQLYRLNGMVKTVLTDPHTGGNLVVDFDTRPEYAGVEIDSLDVCEGIACIAAEIRVDAVGIPYDETGTAFTSPATITLANGSVTRTIAVTQETGFTELV